MFRYTFIMVLLAGFSPEVLGQHTGVSASFGAGAFRMNDLKYIQDYILGTYPVEGATISSFPPYFTSSVSVLRRLYTNIRLGAGYTYSTTGGRSSYSDYSGSINTDMIAVSHSLGASVFYSITGTDHLDLSLYGRVDANFTSVDISSSINVLGLSNGIKNKYKSISPNLSAGLEFLYTFKEAAVGIEGGYLGDIPGKLTNKDTGSELLDPDDRQRTLTADWTGWRIGIKGIVWLNHK